MMRSVRNTVHINLHQCCTTPASGPILAMARVYHNTRQCSMNKKGAESLDDSLLLQLSLSLLLTHAALTITVRASPV